jgi:hypothetical protein
MSNYTDNLEFLLIEKDWKGADIETERLIFSFCNYQQQQWLKAEDIDLIPLYVLARIETLWTTHSQGRFGFGVQEQVHKKIRAEVNTNPRDIFKQMVSDILRGSSDSMSDREVLMVPYFYGVEIGWIEGHPMDFLGAYGKQKSYEELTFDLTAPIGHLPCQIWWTLNYQAKKIPLNVLFKKYGILGIPGSLCKYICSLELLLFKRIQIACQQDIKIYFDRANTHSEFGRFQDAIENYSQILQIDSSNADAYFQRGVARSNLGDYRGAIEDYTQIIQRHSNDDYAYFQRGVARSNLGDYQGAIEDYTQAIKINPNDTYVYYLILIDNELLY